MLARQSKTVRRALVEQANRRRLLRRPPPRRKLLVDTMVTMAERLLGWVLSRVNGRARS